MKRLKLTESDLKRLIKESVKKVLFESVDFEEMEEMVYEVSRPLRDSTAFSKAMDYIKKVNPNLYMELIETEYNEAVQ
jgi:type II secretory pathway component PulF